jgi:hypothetical protein
VSRSFWSGRVSVNPRCTTLTALATLADGVRAPLPAALAASAPNTKTASKLAAMKAVRKRPCLGTKRAG